MYYNTNDNIIVPRVPKNLIKTDGSIFIDFYLSNIDTLSDYGYYTIRSDNYTPPSNNHIEDVSQRLVAFNKPYVDITRVWIDNKIPEQPIATVAIPQDHTDQEL